MNSDYETLCDSSDRQRWLGLRSTGIGASEIAAVLGESPWTSALELYLDKVDPPPVEGETDAPKDHLWVGRKIEDFNASLYADLTGREIRKSGQLIRSAREPWAIATLDYVVRVDGEWCPLEIKNVGATKAGEWSEGPPHYYALQGQQQAMIMRSPMTSFFALIGGNRPVWCDVPADHVDHARITHHGREFWSRVERRAPPMPDGSESAARALARMHAAEVVDSSTALSSNAMHCADELERIKREIRDLSAFKREYEQTVKAELGDNEYGVLPDGRVFSHRTVVREAHEVKRSEYRKLYLHKSQPKPRRT